MFGGNELRENFSEHAQLLEGVDAFDGQIEVKSSGARSLHEYFQSDLREFFVERASNREHAGKFSPFSRVEIEEEIVGMLLVIAAARPGIVVDAAEAGEIEERRKIISDYVLDIFSLSFRRYRNRFNPLGHALRHIFLEKGLTLDPVRITAQHQGPLLEKWKEIFRDAIVVRD